MNLALSAFAAAAMLSLCAAAHGQVNAEAAKPVRQRFVPALPGAANGNGASFSMLSHLPMNEPGVSMVMAHAGVGDSFPIQEEGGPKLFDVLIAAGDDDLLKIEVRRAEGITKRELKRDGTVWVEVAAQWFSISYPSVTVSSKGRPTSEQAMLIVHRFDKK